MRQGECSCMRQQGSKRAAALTAPVPGCPPTPPNPAACPALLAIPHPFLCQPPTPPSPSCCEPLTLLLLRLRKAERSQSLPALTSTSHTCLPSPLAPLVIPNEHPRSSSLTLHLCPVPSRLPKDIPQPSFPPAPSVFLSIGSSRWQTDSLSFLPSSRNPLSRPRFPSQSPAHSSPSVAALTGCFQFLSFRHSWVFHPPSVPAPLLKPVSPSRPSHLKSSA